MKNILRTAIIVFTLVGALQSYAQTNFPGCPAVTTPSSVSIPCGQSCTTLTATAFSAAQTTTYVVDSIPYAPPVAYNAGTAVLVHTDDLWSAAITIPFNFCFFGNTYNQFIIGSNGCVGFTVANAGAFNSWDITGPLPLAAPADIHNCILTPWQDMDPTNTGSIFYQIGGTAPCRYVAVSWYQCPMFGDPNSVNTGFCTTAYQQTQMAVIYETTNAIDIYIQQKGAPCTAWNNGRAVEGIQNAAGTVAYTPAGRNATQWSATNDAHRFMPSGPPNFTISWFHGNTQISSHDTVTVCPTGTSTYVAQATYTNCDNSTVTVSDSVVVTVSNLVINIDSIHQISCHNGTDGYVHATVTDPAGLSSFGWSPGGAGQTSLSNIGPGTYIFSATDSGGCTGSDTVVLVNPPAITLAPPTITNVGCGGGNTGSIIASASGGTGTINYNWNTGGTTNTISGLGIGTYTLTVSDANGCSVTASYNVSGSASVHAAVANDTISSCTAGTTGSLTVIVTGGTTPYAYSWTGGGTTATINNLGAGSYTVTVTDSAGCTATATGEVVAIGHPITFNAPTITNASCSGNTGKIIVSVSGATAPVTYNWSFGSGHTDSLTNLGAGTYTVTAIDAAGCSATASYNVTQPAGITINSVSVINANCVTAGSIAITASGGTGTLTYNWSNGGTGDSIGGLTSGSYFVTVHDAGGCSVTAQYIVGNSGCPGCPSVETNNNVNIPCGDSCTLLTATAFSAAQTTSYAVAPIAYNPPFAFNTGTAILVATDDLWSGVINLPFTFCFFNNPYTQIIVGSNGVVSFNVGHSGNFNNWDIPGPIPEAAPADLRNTIMGPWQDMDPTDAGSIHYNISGTAPCRKFEVAWNRCPMFGDPNSVDPGLCDSAFHQTQMIVIYETTNAIDIYIHEKSYCSQWNNGWAIEGIQNAAGTVGYAVPGRNATQWTAVDDAYRWTPSGAPNYTITWFQGITQIGTGDSIQVCPSATTTYTVNATYTNCDNSQVVVTDTILVTTGGGGTLTLTPTIQNVSCNNGSNGCITVAVSGNTGAVTYLWNNGNTTATNCGLTAGTYTVTVSESGGCSTTGSFTVTQPSAIVAAIATDTVATCGTASGTLTVNVSGGTPSYTFNWSNSSTTQTITGLGAGNYTVTITDSLGCTATASGTVVVVGGSLTLSASITNPTCNGSSNGRITVNASGGTGTVIYTWNDGTGGITDSVLSAGTYCVTATDSIGCSASACYTLTQPSAITDTAIITPPSCAVGGSITVIASGGVGNYTYQWIPGGQTTATISGLAPGDYTVIISDSNGCNTIGVFTVDSGSNSLTMNPPDITNPTCNGSSNGRITANAGGGAGTIIYIWNDGNTGATDSSLVAGTYCVTATDSTGCSASACYTLTQPPPITDTAIITNPSCASGGSITVIASGGVGGFTYQWIPGGQTTATISGLAPGNYTVIISDSNGCNTIGSFTVDTGSNALTMNPAVIVNDNCNGASNGRITANAGGGSGTITYIWNDGNTGATDSSLVAGTYCVTATDSTGCSASACYTITEPAAVVIDTAIITQITCSSSGSISLIVSGGTAPYGYTWLPGGQTTSSISGLGAGGYTVIVVDSNGCSTIGSYAIDSGPSPIIIGQPQITNASCTGNTGSIILNVSGGTPPIVFTWSTGTSTTDTLANLGAGTYTVTITDSSGCSATASYTISGSTPITFNPPVIVNAGCGTSTGSITVSTSGGSGTITYVWSNGFTGNPLSGVAANTYCVTATDTAGCSASACYTITQTTSVVLGQPTIVGASCNGGGSVTATSTGGIGTITYIWSNGETGAADTGLVSGTYCVTATDSVGCSATACYNVGQTSFIVIDSTHIEGVTCTDSGYIVIFASGGTGTLTYTWSRNGNIIGTGDSIGGLSRGGYTVTITDANGCSVTGYFIVGHSICGACPAVSTNNNVSIPCSEQCTTLVATAFSGAQTTTYTVGQIPYNPPIPYDVGSQILIHIDDIWSSIIPLPFDFCFFGVSYNQILVGSNGVVSFNVTNAGNFCDWSIPGPVPFTNPADIDNCIMGPWQDLDPTMQGFTYIDTLGTAPCRTFSVSWYQCPMYGDPNSVDQSFCDSAYHQTQMIVIYETTNAIDVYIHEKATCPNWNGGLAIEGIQNAAGTVAFTVPGRNATQWNVTDDAWRFTPAGAPNYVITWFHDGDTLAVGDSLVVCPDSSTTYGVQALYTNCDGNTILVADSVYVTAGGNLTVTIDSIHPIACNGDSNGAVYASYNAHGAQVTSFGWTPGGANQTILTNLGPGTYIFSVTTATGCSLSDTVTLVNPPPLVITIANDTFTSCDSNAINGTLIANASGGTPGYTYLWSNGATTDTISGLTNGSYTVTVTDSHGCSAVDTGFVVDVVHTLSFNTTINNVLCSGGNTGSIIAILVGSTPPVTYVWNPGTSTTDSLTNLAIGTYCVTATDSAGCSVSACYNITQPSPIVIDSITTTQATCTAGGCAIVVAEGGTGTLIYTWSNAATGDSICGLAGGPYTLTVSDSNGCSVTDSVVITAGPEVVVFGNPIIVEPNCSGDSTGSIIATASGGSGTITFVWSTGATGDSIGGLAAGTYSVTITDSVGCSASTTYILNQPTPVTFGAPLIVNENCNGSSNGSITVNASGGTGTITFIWADGTAGATDSVLAAGTYCVTATDSLGCSATACYTITQPPAIVIDTAIISPLTCSDSGYIVVTASGGTGTLTYLWLTGGVTGDSLGGLAPGTYTVIVTDSLGCSDIASFTVGLGPGVVLIDSATLVNVTCNGGSTGSITTAITDSAGGTLIYIWSNGATTASLSGITAGNYCITATDSIGCSASACYNITQPSAITIIDSAVTQVTCIDSGSIVILATGGTGPITYVWSTIPAQTGDSAGGLTTGTYTVTITDSVGCSITDAFTVTRAPSSIVINPIVDSITCFGLSNGSINLNPGGSYTYIWSDGATTSSLDSLGAITIDVTVTDTTGCSLKTGFTITSPPLLTVSVQYNPLICANTVDTIVATPSGGTPAYDYGWNPAGSGNILIYGGGPFSLTVTDAHGCTAVVNDTITVAPAITLVSDSVTPHPCANPVTGDVHIVATGGLGTLTYTLGGNSNTTGIFNGLSSGTQTFSITDSIGCSLTGSVVIPAGFAPDTFGLITDSVTCFGYNNGAIIVTDSFAHNPPFTYSLNGGTPQSSNIFDSLSAGFDTITITNANGCAYQIDTFIGQPPLVSVTFNPDTVYTYANTAAPLTPIISNFVNPVYMWTPSTGLSCTNCANDSATVTAPSVYYLTVSDSISGCSAFDSVVVIVKGAFQMPDAFTPNGDGHNDFFGPISLSNATIKAFRVYDRWGACVHNSNEPWDGKFKGKDQPPGTYIYYIEATYIDPTTDQTVDQKQEGSVLLLR